MTDPKNRGRKNIGCPFGCRKAHAKAESKKRCAEYYRTRGGRFKKENLNRKAYLRRIETESSTQEAQIIPAETPRFSSEFLSYLSLLHRQIYGIEQSPDSIRQFLNKFFRQRSLALRGRAAYMTLNARDGP